MAICSIWQLDFVPDDGGAPIRLVSFGDWLMDEIELPMEQLGGDYAPIGALWGDGYSLGGAERSFAISTRDDHASHAAARNYCIRRPAEMPIRRDGYLRVAVQGGETWALMSAQVLRCTPRPIRSEGFRTVTTYQLAARKAVPVAGVEATSATPIGWRLDTMVGSLMPIGGSSFLTFWWPWDGPVSFQLTATQIGVTIWGGDSIETIPEVGRRVQILDVDMTSGDLADFPDGYYAVQDVIVSPGNLFLVLAQPDPPIGSGPIWPSGDGAGELRYEFVH